MRRALFMVVLLAASHVARADDDDDDPKSRPALLSRPTPLTRPTMRAPEPRVVAPAPAPNPPVRPSELKLVHASELKPAPAVRAPEPKAAEQKVARETRVVDPARPAASAVPRPAAALAGFSSRPAVAPAAWPAVAAAAPPAPPPAASDEAGVGRTVRVRLVAGEQVLGVVQAELPDALVIDCSLGRLSIPRSRIATLAYGTAAIAVVKRAQSPAASSNGPEGGLLPKKR